MANGMKKPNEHVDEVEESDHVVEEPWRRLDDGDRSAKCLIHHGDEEPCYILPQQASLVMGIAMMMMVMKNA